LSTPAPMISERVVTLRARRRAMLEDVQLVASLELQHRLLCWQDVDVVEEDFMT